MIISDKMKIRIVIFLILNILILSCKPNNIGIKNIIEIKPISKEQYYKYIDKSYYHIQNDSFKVVLYSNVRPLKEENNTPEKIFTHQSYYKNSKKYFSEKLKGKSISFLENNDTIVFRHFFQDYENTSENDGYFRNKKNVIDYLNKNKI